MLKAKREEVALQANKLRNGLGKVEETTKLVATMSEELEVAKVYLNQTAKHSIIFDIRKSVTIFQTKYGR